MDKKVVIGLIIAFLMISSIFGFVIDYAVSPTKRQKYGDFKFKQVNQNYITEINDKERTFVFYPGNLEYIQVSDEVKALLDKPVLTISYDPDSDIAENLGEAQYYLELQLQDIKTIERAITKEGTLPQKTCANSTAEQPVIELRKSEESKIIAENNCIIVNSRDAYDLYQQTERLIYVALGVMK